MYYALYNSKNGYVTITCVQWFDESDYIESRFIKNNGEIVKFDSEEKAILYLNNRFDKKDINPEYYRAKEKLNKSFKEELEGIYKFFSYTDDIHINNEDDNYSYQSKEYSKNLEKLKSIIENDSFI